MKKFLLYLGILLALFSTPQVANAAEVSSVTFRGNLWAEAWQDKPMTKSDKGYYWNGTVNKTSGVYQLKRGWSDGGSDYYKPNSISATADDPSTTGSSGSDGTISNLTTGRPYIFCFYDNSRFGIVNKVELYGDWTTKDSWITGCTLEFNATTNKFEGEITPTRTGVTYGVKLCAGTNQIGWLFPSQTLTASGCTDMSLTGSANGTSNLTANKTYTVSMDPATMKLTVTEKVVVTSGWKLRYSLAGTVNEIPFEEKDGKYVIENSKILNGYGSQDNTDGTYLQIVNGSNVWGNSTAWFNPDNQNERTQTLTTANAKTKFDFKSKTKGYDFTLTPSTKELRITENISASVVPEAFYVRYNTNNSWNYNIAMTKSADGKTFTGSVEITGENSDGYGYISFTDAATDQWNGAHNYGPKGESIDKPAGNGTYNMELGNVKCWKLPKGNWSFTCDFTNPAFPIVRFVESGLYMRYNSYVSTEGGAASINPDTWVFSNPMTTEDGKKYSGIITFIKDTGGAICFATRPSAGWTGAYNYGPVEMVHTAVEAQDNVAVTKDMKLGSTGSWLLGKGSWTFECDLSGTDPTVKFTKVGDGTNEDHDQSICTAPKVYIVGPVTGHGWAANRAWRMSHTSGDHYTFVVPAGSKWTAGQTFKVRVQPYSATGDPEVDMTTTTYYGGVNNIVRNTVTSLTLANSANATNASSTLRPVPAGALVAYNTSTHQITINYDGTEASDASDSWAINASYAVPEVYLVGDRLNNWMPNPGYRMVRSGAQTYRLDRFVIQKDTKFAVRVYKSPTEYTRWGITGSDKAITGKEANLTFDLTTGQYDLKWNNGVAMVSMEFNLERHTLTVIPHPEVPNQANFDSENQVHGVPYVAFVGLNLKQTQSNNSIYKNKTTGEGWTMGWQAYSNNHKRQVLYEDMKGTFTGAEFDAIAGRAVPNLVWPPRNRVDFGDDAGRTWTTDAITFRPADDFKNVTLTKAEAQAKLLENGIKLTDKYTIDIPDNATWTRYDTRNILMAGSFKLWSGWGGELDNGSYQWAYHHNWGLGNNFTTASSVEPNILYPASDETEGQRGGNFQFTDDTHPERYFRQFSFYSARKTNGTYAYFFVARLSAEDPVITSHRVSDKHYALQCKYRIQQQLTEAGSAYETKKITGYKLYISDKDGETFPVDPFYTKDYAGGITIKDFNALAEADRTQTVDGLAAGNYRFKIEVAYEGDANTYEGTSPVMSIVPQIAAKLATEQIREDNGNWTFDIRVNGNVPDEFTDSQKAAVTGYTLEVASQAGYTFPAGAKLTWTEGAEEKTQEITSTTATVTIAAAADHSMPEVRLWNARVGRTYRFTLSMNGDGLGSVPSAVLRQGVQGPRAEMAASMEFANSLGKDFSSATADEISAAVNWAKAKGQITPPAVAAASLAPYEVSYEITYGTETRTVTDAALGEATGGYKNVIVDRLPFDVEAYNATGSVDYKFSIKTVYKENDNYSYTTPAEETVSTLGGALFPAPRGANPDDKIALFENYSERFYGHHSYWQDAFVAMELTELPYAEGLVGSLKQETVNGITGVAPIEAGGNYAFGKLSNEAVTALWYQPMPEGVSGHEHYKGMTGLQTEEGHVIAAAFFAGTGEIGHDARNQWFCTVDHNNDPAAKGFGTVTENESNEFFKDTYKPSGDPNDVITWYKDKRVYRKVHHINHEARYFGDGTPWEDHANWKFSFDEYQPLNINIQYQYNMLKSGNVFTVEAPAAPANAPRRAIAKAPEGDYATVVAGVPETVDLNGTNVVGTYDSITTGIGSVGTDGDNAPVEYYNLQGVKVDNPVPGNVYIFRQGSRSGKIVIK